MKRKASAEDISDAISTLEEPSSTRRGLVSAFKVLGKYKGHSRDNLVELKTHAVVVVNELAPPVDDMPAPAPVAPKASEAPKAVTPSRAEEPSVGSAANTARTFRPETVAKVQAVLASLTPDSDGVLIADASSFTSNGLGKCWVSTSNKQLKTGSQGDAIRSLGYQAHCSRGVMVFTPLAKQQVSQAG